MRLKRVGSPSEHEVEILEVGDGSLRARIDGRDIGAGLQPLADGSAILAIGSRHLRIAGGRRGDSLLVAAASLSCEFKPIELRRAARAGLASPELTAPMPGKVLRILVAEGARVNPGDPVLVLEAMKMETTLSAENPAVVTRIRVTEGQMVDHGAVLIDLGPVPEAARPPS